MSYYVQTNILDQVLTVCNICNFQGQVNSEYFERRNVFVRRTQQKSSSVSLGSMSNMSMTSKEAMIASLT